MIYDNIECACFSEGELPPKRLTTRLSLRTGCIYYSDDEASLDIKLMPLDSTYVRYVSIGDNGYVGPFRLKKKDFIVISAVYDAIKKHHDKH